MRAWPKKCWIKNCKRIKNCWATLRRPWNKRYVESCWPTMLRPFARERYVGNCCPTILLPCARVLHHRTSLPQLTEKKNRHKPSGDVRGVYDVILYECAVILFSSGRQVSKNCKIKMTRKSLLSDFSWIKKH